MDINEMKSAIKDRRLGHMVLKSKVKTFKTFEDRVVASVYYLPSQSYGMMIKNLVLDKLNALESEHGDGYTEDIGVLKVKVCVTDSVVTLKQIKPDEDIQTYIVVVYNYKTGVVKEYHIPEKIVLDTLNVCPCHGSIISGFTNEYTCTFSEDDIKRYEVVTR